MAEQQQEEETEEVWTPKTKLGKKVAKGQITDIKEALRDDRKIMEPEIVDQLTDLEEEVILIGGTPGKGGGKRRTVSKRTARMHKSGARYSSKAMTVLGNRKGVIGIGMGEAEDTRAAIDDANQEAKLSLIQVQKGCGSWECACGTDHTVPFEVTGKSGSVRVTLKPAPKGIGLACSDEVEKLLELAGYEDIWVQARGKTRTRENLIKATFNALKKINEYKRREQ
ncbi:MAG: 30S ribosomal protein S5 [Candidatus Nanohaloarchaea archaeon]